MDGEPGEDGMTIPSPQITGGSGTPDNPTATVKRTVVNGAASTFMRSDAAPALDVSAIVSYSWFYGRG
jgi:hypothetical protein